MSGTVSPVSDISGPSMPLTIKRQPRTTAATALPTDDSHHPLSALRPAQMTSIDLSAAIWHREDQGSESPEIPSLSSGEARWAPRLTEQAGGPIGQGDHHHRPRAPSYRRGRAHHVAICPETMRTAEISSAGR